VRQALKAKIGRIAIDDVKAALFDDFAAPYAVCRPPHDGPSHSISATVAMIVMQPALGSGSQQCFTLPASGWSPIGAIGYKYKDATGAHGAVKVATIKRTPSGTFILKLVANGALGSITVEPPARTDEADVFFRIGAGDRYCSTFGGEFLADAVSAFKAKNAPAPSSCAGVFLLCSPSGAFVDAF